MEKYENSSDEELILEYQNGAYELEEILLNKYKNMILKKAHAMFLIGGEQEDLIQEGMIGLFKALRDYKSDKNTSFSTFANLCVERQMYKAIENAMRQKHKPLNSYISFSDEAEQMWNLEDRWQKDPEEIIIDQENAKRIRVDIKNHLSPLENQVLEDYLEGYDYVKIAERMGKPIKSIDNALQRIRTKVRDMIADSQSK